MSNIKSTKEVFKGPAFRVTQNEIIHPITNEVLPRDIVHHAPVVIILAEITPNNPNEVPQYFLTREFRAGVNQVTYGFPAGFIDDGETPEQAAHRELLEETGFYASEMILVGTGNTSEGFTDEKSYFFFAKIDKTKQGKVDFDEGEFIELGLASLDKLYESIREGFIQSNQCVSTLFHAQLRGLVQHEK